MVSNIRVAILEDHQSVIDGYLYRLRQAPEIEIVATVLFGAELEPLLARQPVDVLLLDVGVRTAPDDPTPYPVLDAIPRLLETHENLAILVVSMYAEPFLIQGAVSAGASGYLLKEDQAAVQELNSVIRLVASGGSYFSRLPGRLQEKTGKLLLTRRQLELLSLCAIYPDLNSQELARKLKISSSTVRNLLSAAYARLGVHNRAAAILKAYQLGLLSPVSDPRDDGSEPAA